MAPKKSAAAPTVAAPVTPASMTVTTANTTTAKTTKSEDKAVWWTLWDYYKANTPQRTKLIDVFMGFLVVVGILQFAYCVLAGNYPFNAFLSGFSATVGQFVLTASLRIQTAQGNKSEFPSVSPERYVLFHPDSHIYTRLTFSRRAFADYVVGSLILHFFCVNFIN
ncbi:DAD family-domain-containing protein [Annulohypoxylon maeteangense]|uniref:DAD family-domain-containing protein n=1 Tax=Annulohypoxylon maeteangense TaxID=1927788 RepID=UPI0020072521|nr:DAD family-domain-containing protein [Annulohypoxylon maeteangense]KAI0890417.1 DAD family-domain-containing protein [Annulohypoxylon maeteangense]